LWFAGFGGVVAVASTKRKTLDVGGDHKSQSGTAWPVVVFALIQWDIVVAVVAWQQRTGHGLVFHGGMSKIILPVGEKYCQCTNQLVHILE